MIIIKIFFFFFQAEDGIRDKLVTGVQTCALPISGFGGGYAGVYGQAVEMVEAGCWRPGRKSFAAEIGETLLEADEVGCGLRVAGGDGAAGAGVAALEIYFADAEADYAALVFAVELIFPECGQVSVRAGRARTSDRAAGVCDFFGPGGVCRYIGGIDFERGAKALAHGIQ